MSRKPLLFASAALAPCSRSSRLFASETPLWNERKPATPQAIDEHDEPERDEQDELLPGAAAEAEPAARAGSRVGLLRGAPRWAAGSSRDRRHLALDATTAVDAIGLVLRRHPAE